MPRASIDKAALSVEQGKFPPKSSECSGFLGEGEPTSYLLIHCDFARRRACLIPVNSVHWDSPCFMAIPTVFGDRTHKAEDTYSLYKCFVKRPRQFLQIVFFLSHLNFPGCPVRAEKGTHTQRPVARQNARLSPDTERFVETFLDRCVSAILGDSG